VRPTTEEMLTAEPPPPSSMRGTAGPRRAWAVHTLKWNAASMMAGDVSAKAWGIHPPTLLTTMSSRPNASRAESTRPATASRSFKSATTTTARRPAASTRDATSASWSSLRAAITTSAPASARATALAAPIPRPAPVTMPTRSVSRNRSKIMMSSPPVGIRLPARDTVAPCRLRLRELSGQVCGRDDPGRVQADQELAGYAVPGAVLLGPVGPHVPAADDGGPVTALVEVLADGHRPFHRDEGKGRR